jgi:hypothetical protein
LAGEGEGLAEEATKFDVVEGAESREVEDQFGVLAVEAGVGMGGRRPGVGCRGGVMHAG